MTVVKRELDAKIVKLEAKIVALQAKLAVKEATAWAKIKAFFTKLVE